MPEQEQQSSFYVFLPRTIKSTDWVSIMMMPMFGLVGGLGAAIIIYLFSWKNGKLDSQRLLLTGIAIGSGFGAFSMYLSLKMKSTDFEMAAVWVSEVYIVQTGSTLLPCCRGLSY